MCLEVGDITAGCMVIEMCLYSKNCAQGESVLYSQDYGHGPMSLHIHCHHHGLYNQYHRHGERVSGNTIIVMVRVVYYPGLW
jgi:hypothetical protein